MLSKFRRILFLIVVSCLLYACSRPVKSSDFCTLDLKTGWNEPVALSVEMLDTVNTSQIDICLQFRKTNFNGYLSVPVVLNIVSPDSLQYTDTLNLPLHIIKESNTYNKHNGHVTLQWPYRKSVITRVPGQWHFTLAPVIEADSANAGLDQDIKELENDSIYKNIIGIGISCNREDK